MLIRRLDGTNGKETISKIVQQINFEEIGHVDFGSQWYRKICKLEKLEATDDFPQRKSKPLGITFVRLHIQTVKQISSWNHSTVNHRLSR